uniref:Wsv419-like protein n=1 Tax=Pasiphaea japonica whispovirus TaxID=2984286 RepID=A0A9C7F117_9VIRU|nr:MAG: wsv419-like protein [Pasiphaea japonica whispovirus]
MQDPWSIPTIHEILMAIQNKSKFLNGSCGDSLKDTPMYEHVCRDMAMQPPMSNYLIDLSTVTSKYPTAKIVDGVSTSKRLYSVAQCMFQIIETKGQIVL